MLKKIIKKINENKNRSKVQFKIKFDRSGLSVEPMGEPYGFENKTLLWADVKRVLVYKRDLFAIDLLCMYFELNDSGLEINEDMEGWDLLNQNIAQYLPGCKNEDDWWPKAAFPAFETNLTEIFTLCKK
ncbi:MAG: hypothetical protein ABR969_04985 [Sedimentisphaerales bacterium]